jgi:hypothetical protein
VKLSSSPVGETVILPSEPPLQLIGVITALSAIGFGSRTTVGEEEE